VQSLGVKTEAKEGDQRHLDGPHKFNWGAFFLTWIWAIGNKSLDITTVILLILCIVPYLGLPSAIALALYSGFTGNRRAWGRRTLWRDEAHFVRIQRRWAFVGTAQFVLVVFLLLFLPIFYEK
jgi:hypothetical protein